MHEKAVHEGSLFILKDIKSLEKMKFMAWNICKYRNIIKISNFFVSLLVSLFDR